MSSIIFIIIAFSLLERQSISRPHIIPSPVGAAQNLNTIEEFWDILFPASIIEIIVRHTNTEIENVCAKLIAKNTPLQSYHHHTDVTDKSLYKYTVLFWPVEIFQGE